jgi:invasion protein IalB
MRSQRSLSFLRRRAFQTFEYRLVEFMLLATVLLLASSAETQELEPGDINSGQQTAPTVETKDRTQEHQLEELLHAAETLTQWNVSCEKNGHCVIERKVPLHDARPDDQLILQVDLDSPKRPDLLVLVAPKRAREDAGITVAFLTRLGAEGVDIPTVHRFPVRCFETGCGTALPLTTELEAGRKISDQLGAGRMLRVVFELDEKPNRALIVLEPLRDAIEELGRGAKLRAGP